MFGCKKTETETKETDAKSLERESQEREERHRLVRENIVLFPGSIEEYERFRGYKVEIVDTTFQDKGIYYEELFDDFLQDSVRRINNQSLAKLLINENVEALVNISFRPYGSVFGGAGGVLSSVYGLPVRKAKEGRLA